MNFGFTEEQELLRQQVRKFLEEQCPMEEVRRIAETADGYATELWKQLGELGCDGCIVYSWTITFQINGVIHKISNCLILVKINFENHLGIGIVAEMFTWQKNIVIRVKTVFFE